MAAMDFLRAMEVLSPRSGGSLGGDAVQANTEDDTLTALRVVTEEAATLANVTTAQEGSKLLSTAIAMLLYYHAGSVPPSVRMLAEESLVRVVKVGRPASMLWRPFFFFFFFFFFFLIFRVECFAFGAGCWLAIYLHPHIFSHLPRSSCRDARDRPTCIARLGGFKSNCTRSSSGCRRRLQVAAHHSRIPDRSGRRCHSLPTPLTSSSHPKRASL